MDPYSLSISILICFYFISFFTTSNVSQGLPSLVLHPSAQIKEPPFLEHPQIFVLHAQTILVNFFDHPVLNFCNSYCFFDMPNTTYTSPNPKRKRSRVDISAFKFSILPKQYLQSLGVSRVFEHFVSKTNIKKADLRRSASPKPHQDQSFWQLYRINPKPLHLSLGILGGLGIFTSLSFK